MFSHSLESLSQISTGYLKCVLLKFTSKLTFYIFSFSSVRCFPLHRCLPFLLSFTSHFNVSLCGTFGKIFHGVMSQKWSFLESVGHVTLGGKLTELFWKSRRDVESKWWWTCNFSRLLFPWIHDFWSLPSNPGKRQREKFEKWKISHKNLDYFVFIYFSCMVNLKK